MAQAGDLESGQIPIERASKLLMIGEERIRQHIKAGQIPRGTKRGFVPLVGAVQGRLRYLQSELDQASQASAATRTADARTRLLELRIAEEEGRLCDVEEANFAMDTVAALIVTELQGLPARFTRDMAMRDRLEEEIRAMRSRVAGKVAEMSKKLATGEAA